ncbi:MAG: aldehyde ferredoxin oxidoreductase N-terminal domain-containing protein [Dehalococcoidales bacterium]
MVISTEATVKGYAGSILLCDLSRREISRLDTMDYAAGFLGGRGLAASLYWHLAAPVKEALGPENPLIFVTGPLAGFSGLAGSRWQVYTRSPSVIPPSFSYSNMGGSWGTHLKLAGFDALVVTGVADSPVYLFIHDGICEFRDADHLRGMGAARSRESLKAELGKAVRILAIGPGGERVIPFATILADDDASGSGGAGAVMGYKGIKAIAVAGKGHPQPHDPRKLEEITRYLRELKRREPREDIISPPGMKMSRKACLGCIAGCLRSTLRRVGGEQGKYLCTSGFFYEDLARDYYRQDNEVPFLANRLCDDVGLDINTIDTMIRWLCRCYQRGVIPEKEGGIPLSRPGSYEFIRSLVESIASREGLGAFLAGGIYGAAEHLGHAAGELIPDNVCRDGTGVAYGPRMYPANALIFATEPRQSIPMTAETGRTVLKWLEWMGGGRKPETADDNREPALPFIPGNPVSLDDMAFIARRFWGTTQAMDFSTYRGKARAAKAIQDRHSLKESAILCHFSWHTSQIEFFRPGIIAEVINAVTGQRYDEDGIYGLGERIYNLQRAIHILERNRGREYDVLPGAWYDSPLAESFLNPELLAPGSGGKPVTRKGAVLDREEVELMKDEYYRLRGWDEATGLQTEAKLKALGLDAVSKKLSALKLTR